MGIGRQVQSSLCLDTFCFPYHAFPSIRTIWEACEQSTLMGPYPAYYWVSEAEVQGFSLFASCLVIPVHMKAWKHYKLWCSQSLSGSTELGGEHCGGHLRMADFLGARRWCWEGVAFRLGLQGWLLMWREQEREHFRQRKITSQIIEAGRNGAHWGDWRPTVRGLL